MIQSPGMREFGLWNIDALELAELFPELRPHLGTCRFGLDRSHTHEPGCAVTGAIQTGEVTERRYRSYPKMARKVAG